MTMFALTLALLSVGDIPPVAYAAPDAPPVAYVSPAPTRRGYVLIASSDPAVAARGGDAPLARCPCPHCPPGCDGTKGYCPRYVGKCCGLCICPAWGGQYSAGPMTPGKTMPVASPAPTAWQRVDSRGIRWTHADRGHLDRYVDSIEQSYGVTTPRYAIAPVAAYGASCAGGQCGVSQAPAMRSGFRFFGRR